MVHLNLMPSASEAADALLSICGAKWLDCDVVIREYLATATADVLNEGAGQLINRHRHRQHCSGFL
jgi:hypothetical protein